MIEQTEAVELAQGRFCKAGFWHAKGTRCDHIVALPVAPVAKKVLPSIVPDDYYSPESMAARREENRKRYQPTHRPFNRHQISAAVNEPRELGDRGRF